MNNEIGHVDQQRVRKVSEARCRELSDMIMNATNLSQVTASYEELEDFFEEDLKDSQEQLLKRIKDNDLI